MPLIELTLQKQLEQDIKDLEKKLFDALNDKKKGIYFIQEELDKQLSKNIPKKNFDAEKYKKDVWEKVSKEWSKSLSEQMISILSKELSSIISKRITAYIKTATVAVAGTTGTIS